MVKTNPLPPGNPEASHLSTPTWQHDFLQLCGRRRYRGSLGTQRWALSSPSSPSTNCTAIVACAPHRRLRCGALLSPSAHHILRNVSLHSAASPYTAFCITLDDAEENRNDILVSTRTFISSLHSRRQIPSIPPQYSRLAASFPCLSPPLPGAAGPLALGEPLTVALPSRPSTPASLHFTLLYPHRHPRFLSSHVRSRCRIRHPSISK